MPTFVPVTLQSFLWPLAGAGLLFTVAALLFAVGSFVPSWLRRVVAATAAVLGLLAIAAARDGIQVAIPWQPLNLFRTAPAFRFDDLSAPVAILVSGVTAALLLGVRGRAPNRTQWHVLALIALAGVVIMAAAGNMLALLLGSALIDLALIAAVLFAVGGEGDAPALPLTSVVPGLVATLLLFFGAVQMDAEVGHASLHALTVPESTLMLIASAGVLRLMVFPLHPRGISRPEDAALLLLPTAAGIYLISRAQHIAPVLPTDSWLAILAAGALLAGGLALWSGMLALPSITGKAGPGGRPVLAEAWPAALIHRTGYVVFFAVFVPAAPPWTLLGVLLPLAVLAICWDLLLDEPLPPRAQGFASLYERIEPWWQEQQARIIARWRWIERWRAWQPERYLLPVILVLALASLLGLPLTVGMRDRWPLYAALLRRQSPWLVLALVADTWLAAGVWRIARSKPGWLRLASRPPLLSMLAAVVLSLAILVAGLAPGALGLPSVGIGRVSAWGLAFCLLLPWLLGAWLAGLDGELARYAGMVRRFLALDWLYAGAGRLAAALLGVFYWLGQVAEGAGWLGWALVVLALAAVLLAVR